MQVKNRGLANAELNNGGIAYRADEHGVFDVPDSVGEMLLTLPGYVRPRDTLEKRRAYVGFKAAQEAFSKAEAAFNDARDALLAAQTQADRGEGTEPGGGAEANGAAVTAVAPPKAEDAVPAKPGRKPAKATLAATPTPEAEAKAPNRSPEALKAKHGGEPTMKWPVEDLRDFARGLGIDAQDDWHKVQVYGEIEAINGE
jgi:hypothetical protein